MFGVEARGIFSLQRPRTPRWACLGVRRDEIVKTRITCPYGARYLCLLHENVREGEGSKRVGGRGGCQTRKTRRYRRVLCVWQGGSWLGNWVPSNTTNTSIWTCLSYSRGS